MGKEENLSFDDFFDQDKLEREKEKVNSIEYVRSEFLRVEKGEWQDLFVGYKKLQAITFSLSLGFAIVVSDHFEETHIIIGSPLTINTKLESIMATQIESVKEIQKLKKKDKSKIYDKLGKSMFLKLSRVKSHEKIYLLSDENTGKYRVIVGSSNMSHSAFKGMQRENIVVFDGVEAFDYYLDIFETLYEEGSDVVERKVIDVNHDDNAIDEVPIAKTILVEKMFVIEDDSDSNTVKEEVYRLRVDQTVENVKRFIPSKKGKTLIFTDQDIKKIKRKVAKVNYKKEETVLPSFEIDYFDQKIQFNKKDFELGSSFDLINNDIALFIEYMRGFDDFHGDVEDLKASFYRYAVWFFASPFIPYLRYTASINNKSKEAYPVYGLIHGQSKAGKTTFMDTLMIMMLENKYKITGADFTRSKIHSLKYTLKGIPVVVDDLENSRFREHTVPLVKDDEFGMLDELFNYPCISISSNDTLTKADQAMLKRMIVLKVSAGITNIEAVEKYAFVGKIQSEMKNNFYREYAKRMLNEINVLVENLENPNNFEIQDIFKTSSKIMLELFNESGLDFSSEDYIREYSYKDFFSEKNVARVSINRVIDAWKIDPTLFKVDNKANTITFETGDNTGSMAREIKRDMPEPLEAQIIGRDLLNFKLDAAREFFQLEFLDETFVYDFISELWNTSPKSFQVDKKNNRLTINLINFERNEIERLVNNCPTALEIRSDLSKKVSFNYLEAIKYFNNDFSTTLIQSILNRIQQ